MFCDQCQETMAGSGCTRGGVCGKSQVLADLQDLLVWSVKGLGAVTTRLRKEKKEVPETVAPLVRTDLCVTMTNACFDTAVIEEQIARTVAANRELRPQVEKQDELPEAACWEGAPETYADKAAEISAAAAEEDADIRSFHALITNAAKGIASMLQPAVALGEEDPDIDIFLQRALGQCLDQTLGGGNLFAISMEAGRYAIRAMDALMRARTGAYGEPEMTKVSTQVQSGKGILVTGSSLKDLAQLLEQTKDTGLRVYTHGELLCAHAYPGLKKYSHLAGHYGGTWRTQKEDFERFHGPVLATAEGIMIPKTSYKDRLYTTGFAAVSGCTHIGENAEGEKDFSDLIRQAETCEGPEENTQGVPVTGFGHEELSRRAHAVAESVRDGSLKKIAVLIGEDGRAKKRAYYTDLAGALPREVSVLTAGSIWQRLPEDTAELAGMPRIAHTGELADAYAVIQFLLRLREELSLDNLNQLPVFVSLAWYGQKSVAVLLSLLYLDIKRIWLGPSLPAFCSDGVRQLLTGYFSLQETGAVAEDLTGALGEITEWITEDMIVGDIVRTYPSLVPVMAKAGLHCIGCGVSQIENLREACATHGLDVRSIKDQLNEALRGGTLE